MPRPLPPRTSIARTGLVANAHIVQTTRALFRSLWVEQPGLILIRSGAKAVHLDDGAEIATKGDLVLLAPGRSADIENRPHEGIYAGEALIFDPNLTEAFYRRMQPGQRVMGAGSHRAFAPSPGTREAWSALTDALAADDPPIPDTIIRHRAEELLLWLLEQGVAFPPREPPTMVDQTRALLAGELAADWTARRLASKLGVSEATLRRRLSAQGHGFAELLTELRLSRALEMLQTTDRSISDIAFEVGYNSSSRFSVRFKARFSIAPRDIRHAARPDWNGTKPERQAKDPKRAA